jgi:hypothetical protein
VSQPPTAKKSTKFKPGAANPGHKSQRPSSGAGRKKGSKNKFSRDIKTAILNALETLGGDEWFVKLGRSAKTKPSMAGLIKALIPIQIQGSGPGTPDEQAQKLREKLAAMKAQTSQPPKDDKP